MIFVFEPEFRSPDAVRGLDGYDYIWLVWQFSTVVQAGQDGTNWRPTVRPPRLGGNTRMGVFATRSPFRPNALGLSSVKLLKVEPNTPQGPVLTVGGADLLDGTPIFDIKPYLPYVDAHPDARGGFTDTTKFYTLQVQAEPEVLEQIPADKRDALLGVLRSDPRPSYQHDPERLDGEHHAQPRVQDPPCGWRKLPGPPGSQPRSPRDPGSALADCLQPQPW